jgi:hypothetical protein
MLECGGLFPSFLTSALDGGNWSASRPYRFTPGERAPDTHWIGGWMDPRTGLNAVKKRKIFPRRESNPGLQSCATRIDFRLLQKASNLLRSVCGNTEIWKDALLNRDLELSTKCAELCAQQPPASIVFVFSQVEVEFIFKFYFVSESYQD